jgi:hypothetical protein
LLGDLTLLRTEHVGGGGGGGGGGGAGCRACGAATGALRVSSFRAGWIPDEEAAVALRRRRAGDHGSSGAEGGASGADRWFHVLVTPEAPSAAACREGPSNHGCSCGRASISEWPITVLLPVTAVGAAAEVESQFWRCLRCLTNAAKEAAVLPGCQPRQLHHSVASACFFVYDHSSNLRTVRCAPCGPSARTGAGSIEMLWQIALLYEARRADAHLAGSLSSSASGLDAPPTCALSRSCSDSAVVAHRPEILRAVAKALQVKSTVFYIDGTA